MFNKIKGIGGKKGLLSMFLLIIVSFSVSFLGNIMPVRSAFFTNCTDTATTGIPQIQCESLEALYESTNGDNWTDNTNWGTNSDVSTWTGVYTSGGNVDLIILDNNNLRGDIPDEIEDLTSLTRLDLSSNELFGIIPNEIGNINSLERIYLDDNSLIGAIPASFGALPNLQRLYLDHNQLTGTLPITAGSFSALTRLRLGMNSLTGVIPTDIGGMTNLESLYIEDNQLSGEIPIEIGNLTSLTEIWLQGNKLSGIIPTEIGNLTSLTKLFLNSNELTGSIPTEIENLVNLDYLSLSYNQLDGVIPDGIGNLIELQNVYLNNNNLIGPLPTTLTNLTKLIRFYIQNNKLSGIIPDLTGSLLDYFSIENNNFVFGDFESEFLTYKDYSFFDYISQGQVDTEKTINVTISSTLTITPEVPENANDIYTWFLNGTEIEGYTDRIYTKPTHAEDAGIYTYEIRNSVVGGEVSPAYFLYSHEIEVVTESVCLNVSLTISQVECEALENLYASFSEEDWTDKTNWRFEPDVNTWYGVTVTGGTVTALDLSNNNLVGTISSDIENLPNLTVLNLSGNKIRGIISSEILNLTNLTTLYLYGNELTGSIPANITNLINLTHLGLSSNELTGEIPTSLGNMINLIELNLSNNSLTGIIPNEIGNLTNMIQLSLANNLFIGDIPTTLGNLSTTLTSLDLSGNKITGEISTEITNLTNLTYLLLNDNRFLGNLPTELLGLSNLITISLSGNYFSGDIPNFSTISSLTNLDLHDNRFIFEDFESEFLAYNGLTSFVYAPQKKVDEVRTVKFIEGEPFKIIPQVPANPSGNDHYKWYKYGIEIPDATDRIYQAIAEKDDEEVYTYQITNTTFVDGVLEPTLILTSEEITVRSGDDMQLVDCTKENITGIPELECETLKDFFSYTNGTAWKNNTNWGKSTNVGIWYGLTVKDGHVNKIDLRDNNLNGILLESFTNLTQLEELLLRDNTLYGVIPTTIGNLTKLIKLELFNNKFGGGIPVSIGNLINLKELMLSNNSFTGPIPTEIGNLINLEILNLDQNQLSCDIPDSIMNLTKLLYQLGLQISGNNLNIPVDTASDFYIFLEKVSAVGVNHFTNQNTSTCNVTNLPPTGLSLSNKTIEEESGSGAVIGELTALDSDTPVENLVFTLISGDGDADNAAFQIFDNDGHIEIQTVDNLDFEIKSSYTIRVNVSDGESNYAKSFTIEVLDIRDSEFFDCSGVTYIPVSECEALVDFYNALDGDNSDLNWKTEEKIKDWNNLEFEETPTQLDKDKDGILEVDDENDFNSCVPDDTVDACTKTIEKYVTKISGQYLNGEIPPTIKDFKYLKILKLDNNNNISGTIPKELGDLNYLEHLLLANNKFVGFIPVELANISTLETLSLSRNKLSGTIPSEFGNLLELRYFHVFDNKLSCYIPDSFLELKNLVDGDGFRIADNQIIIPQEDTDLFSFLSKKSPTGEANFTLQTNPYCGEIPTDLILDSQIIDENQPIESLVGNLSTNDEDGAIFTYSLVDEIGDTDNDSFKIIGSTLVSAEIFDYEVKDSYLVRINTNDGDNNLEKLFTISINNVNLAPTDIYLSSNIIPEQQIVTTPIGTFTSEDDGESDTLTYSLVGGVGATDNSSFLINGDELQANRVFDFDVQSVFSIRVNVNDGDNDFSKVFIITISSDIDGDGITDSEDINSTDACLPDANSLACLSQDLDRDNVADGADLDPNDPCIPYSASEACRNKWGPLWDLLYGDGEELPPPIPEEKFDACGQSCRYSIERYEGGYFTGATGKDGVFRTGDYITYIPPKGHPLETYHINYSKLGVWEIKKAYQSVQIKPGYIDHQKISFPLHVKNGEGKQIIVLKSPEIIIDNNPAIYQDMGHFIGASGLDGAFMEGDELRYFGPVDRNQGDTFEIDLHQVGMSDFLQERYPWILNNIESWYGKYLDVYVTVTDKSGNANQFKGPRIWFGKVIDIKEENEKRASVPQQKPKEKEKKIPQKNKNPFFRPEDPYDMILKKNLDKQLNRPPEPKVIEDFDLRKDLEKEFGVISKPEEIINPFPAKPQNPKTSALRKRLLQKRQKPKKKEDERPTLREFLQGLVK